MHINIYSHSLNVAHRWSDVFAFRPAFLVAGASPRCVNISLQIFIRLYLRAECRKTMRALFIWRNYVSPQRVGAMSVAASSEGGRLAAAAILKVFFGHRVGRCRSPMRDAGPLLALLCLFALEDTHKSHYNHKIGYRFQRTSIPS